MSEDLQPAASDGGEQVLFEGRPALVPSLGALTVAILTLGLALIYFWLRQVAKHYRLTTERVVVESGLLGKRMNQIDIYRINDFVVERPFGQRIVGTGNLVLKSMDRSHPELRLYGLKTDVRELYEELRRATEKEKQRRGVRMVDYE